MLVERMAGAHIHMVTKEEYTRQGSVALGLQLAEELRAQVRSKNVRPSCGKGAIELESRRQAFAMDARGAALPKFLR